MNTIWILLIAGSVILAILTGRVGEFTRAIFEGAKSAVEVSLFLLGIVALWLGITRIIEESGLIHSLSRGFRIFVACLFPQVPGTTPRSLPSP